MTPINQQRTSSTENSKILENVLETKIETYIKLGAQNPTQIKYPVPNVSLRL